MAAVSVATVAKKAAEVLASNKKGRKIIGYVIGIAVVLLLLPVLMVYALFGWMAGDVDSSFGVARVAQEGAVHGALAYVNKAYTVIASTFSAEGLTESDASKAQAIYLKYLVGKEISDTFYTDYAECFLKTSKDQTVYSLINEKFEVQIADDHIKELDEKFGITPIRVTEEPSEPETGQQKGN